MAGDPQMWETAYGAGYGYGYDIADIGTVGAPGDMSHTHFVVWLIVFALAAVALLGGFKAWGIHFVVKT